MRGGIHVVVVHAGLDEAFDVVEAVVLYLRGLPGDLHLVGTFLGPEDVDVLGGVDESRLGKVRLEIVREGHGDGGRLHPAYGRLGLILEGVEGELAVVVLREAVGGEVDVAPVVLDAPNAPFGRESLRQGRFVAAVDHRHVLVQGEDDRHGELVPGSPVREPAKRPPHELLLVLHHQVVDLVLTHDRADSVPSALHLLVRSGIEEGTHRILHRRTSF